MEFLLQVHSKRPKAVTVLCWTVLAFAIYSGLNRHNFEPSEVVSGAIVALAALVSLLAAVAYWRNDNPALPHNRSGPIRGLLAICGFAVCPFAMVWMASFGMAAAVLQVGSYDIAVEAKVVSVYPERTGKGFHYRLQLHAPASPGPISPCVSEALWRALKTGDTVTLVFATNVFGTQIVDVKTAE